jgi:hypothetical protein
MALQDGRSHAVWKPHLAGALRGLTDLVLPPRSLEGHDLVQVTGLSAEAWSRIRFLEDPVCDGCGAPFEHAQADIRCAACLARPRAFARARAACLYDDASRDLILKLVDQGQEEFGAVAHRSRDVADEHEAGLDVALAALEFERHALIFHVGAHGAAGVDLAVFRAALAQRGSACRAAT